MHSVIRSADCENLATLTFSPYIIRVPQKNRKSLLLVSRELNISTIITQKNCFITIAEHVCNDAL